MNPPNNAALLRDIRAAISRAERITPPELAILIECAWESESDPDSAAKLEQIIESFKHAAETATPVIQSNRVVTLIAELGRNHPVAPEALAQIASPLNCDVHTRVTDGDDAWLIVGVQSAESAALSATLAATKPEEAADLAASVASQTPRSPFLIGIGVAETESEAVTLSKRALFREADSYNADIALAELERRTFMRINRAANGGAAFGGSVAVMSVNIEKTGEGYCAVSVGGYDTSYAKIKLGAQ
ncbi:MAG: fumarate hydratase [Oscillospiraceae bacterium]|jgi:tartrate dehydratase alpha subunit/fumarate hydratase class I-like protein|nr:fumarate hydratase [Oscillospiraceae bacterium]